jgi:hypothetical protein
MRRSTRDREQSTSLLGHCLSPNFGFLQRTIDDDSREVVEGL